MKVERGDFKKSLKKKRQTETNYQILQILYNQTMELRNRVDSEKNYVDPSAIFKTTLVPAVTIIKSTNYLWQSYVTSRAIPGIPGFKPKSPTTVLIKSSAKSGKIVDLYTLSGSLVSLVYQKGSGLLLVTQGPTDYGISLIKTP